MKFSKNLKHLESSGIRKVFDLVAKLKNPVNFSIGEPDFNVPKKVQDAAIKAIKSSKNKYTQTAGLLELREKIVQKLKTENNIKVPSGNVMITSGTGGGMHLLFQVLLNPGDEVIITEPYFVIHKYIPETFGAKVVTVSSYPDFSLPVEGIERAITKKTKMVIINSPNNPTGKVYREAEIKNLIDVLKKRNILLVSDEIYEKFIYDDKHFSPASLYKNTFTLNGFSKAYAMTGWRVGYAVGSKDIISEMMKLQQYTYVCAPSISQYAVLEAFKTDTKKITRGYKKKRDIIYEGLKDFFEIEKPGGAFYVFPKAPEENASGFTERAVKKGVLIVPGSVFSKKDTHFRLSFAASNKDLKKGIEILRSVTK